MTTTGGATDESGGGDDTHGNGTVGEPARDDERHVVTVFLRNAGEVLLLRRSEAVGTYAGLWGGVSGDAEGDPDAAARWEIDEETGLGDAVTVVRRGDAFTVVDEALGTRWVVHPFLFDCSSRRVEPNRETNETAWVSPTEILHRVTVPKLWTAYDRVRPTVERIADDTEHGSAWLSLRALEVLRDEAGTLATGSASPDEQPSERRTDWETAVDVATALLDARPSMAALATRVNRAMTDAIAQSGSDAATARAVERCAHDGVARAADAESRVAEAAADRIAGETVLTLSRSGTVERALTTGDPAHVYVAESRPAREGVGVAERLAECGVDVTLVTDAAIAHVLGEREIDRVVVGADTVLRDGSVVNKTGTRGAAIVATVEDVPMEAVTAADKIATTTEVVGETGPATGVYDGDVALGVENPTFDHTPAAYVTGVVTERGVLDPSGVADVAAEFRALTAWQREQ